ncbi:MAG: RNA polymerase sigma factor [Gemmatimonadota bacterium]
MSRDEGFAEDFRRIFAEEFDSLFRYLSRLTGDPALATDIAQEAFVRLYQRGEWPRDRRAWLAAVSNNLVRDEHRKRSRRRNLHEAHPTMFMYAEPEPAPDEELVVRERRRRVRRALDRLPLRYRQALLMRHEGYSYQEIASALDYRASGVGKLIVRATLAFRIAYEEADASG